MKQAINKVLQKFGVELHGTGYLQALAKGEFKKDTFAIQKELSQTDCKIVFDVGANRGDISNDYHRTFPSATVFAFEPFPESFNILRQRFAGNHKIKPYQLALASEIGTKTFYVNKNVDTNSLLQPQETGLSSDKQVKNITTIQVDTFTIDAFCKQNSITHIDILKMDVQGGELDVLKGAQALLEQQKVDVIYSEVYFVEQYVGHPLFHDISKFVHQYGFYLQDMYSPIYGKGSIAWADAIFIRR